MRYCHLLQDAIARIHQSSWIHSLCWHIRAIAPCVDWRLVLYLKPLQSFVNPGQLLPSSWLSTNPHPDKWSVSFARLAVARYSQPWRVHQDSSMSLPLLLKTIHLRLFTMCLLRINSPTWVNKAKVMRHGQKNSLIFWTIDFDIFGKLSMIFSMIEKCTAGSFKRGTAKESSHRWSNISQVVHGGTERNSFYWRQHYCTL